jgi:hypothetical protein
LIERFIHSMIDLYVGRLAESVAARIVLV